MYIEEYIIKLEKVKKQRTIGLTLWYNYEFENMLYKIHSKMIEIKKSRINILKLIKIKYWTQRLF